MQLIKTAWKTVVKFKYLETALKYECHMPASFSPQFVVYQSVIERYKHRNLWNYSFAFLVCVCVKPGVVTLKKEHILQVFRNRLRRMFGPKTEEVRDTVKLHNLEVCDLYSSRKMWVMKSRRKRLVVYIIYIQHRGDLVRTSFYKFLAVVTWTIKTNYNCFLFQTIIAQWYQFWNFIVWTCI